MIDHHSDSGAFAVSPAMIYLEHYPFLSKLWYGEGFPYDTASPDFWLVEMSGLVFGLTAEMLRYESSTPYHFKGMLFGESNRWQSGLDAETVASDPFVPVALWNLWKERDIASSTMYGWWLGDVDASAVPVTSSNPSLVKVTSYSLPTSAILAIASFATEALVVTLTVNNSILGLPGYNTTNYCLMAPSLPPFQTTKQQFAMDAPLAVPSGQGWILLLQECAW